MAETGRTHRPRLDTERCKVCDLCRMLCPELAITKDEEAECMRIDLAFCKGCGICAGFCPQEAMTMVSEDETVPEDDSA